MSVKHESNQVKSIEKTLKKVKGGEEKFVIHELVIQGLKSLGAENKINTPSHYKSK